MEDGSELSNAKRPSWGWAVEGLGPIASNVICIWNINANEAFLLIIFGESLIGGKLPINNLVKYLHKLFRDKFYSSFLFKIEKVNIVYCTEGSQLHFLERFFKIFFFI